MGSVAVLAWSRSESVNAQAAILDASFSVNRFMSEPSMRVLPPESFLTVVGTGAVLAFEMLVEQFAFDRLEICHVLHRHEGHVGDAFEGDCRLYGFCHRISIGKWTMAITR